MTGQSRTSTLVQVVNVSGICRRVVAVGGRHRTRVGGMLTLAIGPKSEVTAPPSDRGRVPPPAVDARFYKLAQRGATLLHEGTGSYITVARKPPGHWLNSVLRR